MHQDHMAGGAVHGVIRDVDLTIDAVTLPFTPLETHPRDDVVDERDAAVANVHRINALPILGFLLRR
jgi:hypothetical protein